MTDRELLELAANATGEKWKWVESARFDYSVPGLYHFDFVNEVDYYFAWDPLEDDEDAFRLAIKLRISFDNEGLNKVTAYNHTKKVKVTLHYTEDESIARIVRRAIVMAAAEIGRNMK